MWKTEWNGIEAKRRIPVDEKEERKKNGQSKKNQRQV
jgi:hypothetical protein